MSNRTKAILAVVLAAFFAACNYALIRFLGKNFSPIAMSYLRVGIAICLLYLFFRSRISFRRLFKASFNQVFLFLTTGALGWGLYVYFATTAVTKTLIINVTFIESCLPVVIYLYSVFWLREKFSLGRVMFAVVSIYGALVIAAKSFLPVLSRFGVGEVYALLDTLLLGLSFVGRKKLHAAFNTIEVSFVFMVFAFVMLLGIAGVTGDRLVFSDFTFVDICLTIMNGLFLGLSVLCVNYGLKHLSPTLAGQLNLTKIIFAFALSLIFFMEIPDVYSIIGGGLIVAGVYLSQRYFS